MKILTSLLLFCSFTIGFANPIFYNLNNEKTEDINLLIEEMIIEMGLVQKQYDKKIELFEIQIKQINKSLKTLIAVEEKIELLLQKDQLKDLLYQLKIDNTTDISKIRYIKGLQIIRILYEKVLGLDHHFASVITFSEISKMANPNQYPEFEKVNETLKGKKEKKYNFDLTAILAANPIASAVNTFSNLLVTNMSKDEKDAELKKVECILDFTLRMQNDLNIIYFETAYLQSSNAGIKTDIEQLFKDYTKSLSYGVELLECRKKDDWDTITLMLDNYLVAMTKSEASQKNKMLINLEFPVDRLIQFITQYNNFINEGVKFYQKFETILNSYENEKKCESKIPLEFKKLKADIKIAIEKFNVAYRPVEVNGSKMKEILYGINEFQ